MDGILGGHNYYDAEGKFSSYSVPGLFGGENIYLNHDDFGAGSDDSDGFGDFLDSGYDE